MNTGNADEVLSLARQHRKGTVHTRDLGNPCAGCGQPGPSTQEYCSTCMIEHLAHALERQVTISTAYEQAGGWLAAELERARKMIHDLGMEGVAKENAMLRAQMEETILPMQLLEDAGSDAVQHEDGWVLMRRELANRLREEAHWKSFGAEQEEANRQMSNEQVEP